MGQALYRTYRPKSLAEVVGQKHVTQTLANAIKEGRISHAYLLTGPRGVGKTSIARILAHEINQLPYTDETQHLDIIEIDAASNNGVEDVRDLREKILLAPTSAKYKVYIIDEVHMLSNAAFNALLKTLEEPPAHAIFILATTEVHKLPATIISRTQRFQFQPVSRDIVVKHLKHIAAKEHVTIDDDALHLIAEHGDGGMRDSISLLDQLRSVAQDGVTAETVESTLGLAPRAVLEKLLTHLQAGKVQEAITAYEQLLGKGIAAPALASQLIAIMRVLAMQHPKLYHLIDQLIEVPRAYNPRLKMEVVLATFALDHADQSAPPASSHTPTHTPPAIKKELPKESKKAPAPAAAKAVASPPATPQATAKTDAPAPTASTELGELTDDLWHHIMAEAKDNGPTLYTLIRQAMPYFDVEKQLLTITFRFPLHQKRLDEQRHKQAFGNVLQKIWGGVPEMQIIVNKDAVKHIKPATPRAAEDIEEALPEEAKATSSVMDLMGGGEVVSV